jgi:predicted flavoprotein YhiN
VSDELSCEIAIVGAGAAGLWAAGIAARAGCDVLLLEKTPRTGTKVLASGGTRCNLTTTLDAQRAGDLFGAEGARFLRSALRALSPEELRARFGALGVETVEAPLEKVFPKSGRARDVRDALEREARACGARILLDASVVSIERGNDGWRVAIGEPRNTQGAADDARAEKARGGDSRSAERRGARSRTTGPCIVAARRLILSPGGMSYPRTGTTGDGYRWLEALELPVIAPVPALVPLSSPASWVHELSGIAVQDVVARLRGDDRREYGVRHRPVLFTHRGISGPGAMDLSVHVARGEAAAKKRGAAAAFTLELDLLPNVSREGLRDLLIESAGRSGAPVLSRALATNLPRRLVQAVARQAGLGDTDPRVNGLDRAARHRIVEALKALAIPIEGTLGFDLAEVTAGGLALTHVDPGTMRVRGHEALYACGEILDLAGPIGGLNFQAAFATAELAARDAAKRA